MNSCKSTIVNNSYIYLPRIVASCCNGEHRCACVKLSAEDCVVCAKVPLLLKAVSCLNCPSTKSTHHCIMSNQSILTETTVSMQISPHFQKWPEMLFLYCFMVVSNQRSLSYWGIKIKTFISIFNETDKKFVIYYKRVAAAIKAWKQ